MSYKGGTVAPPPTYIRAPLSPCALFRVPARAQTACTNINVIDGEHFRTTGLPAGEYACSNSIEYGWCAAADYQADIRAKTIADEVCRASRARTSGPTPRPGTPEAPGTLKPSISVSYVSVGSNRAVFCILSLTGTIDGP